MENPQNTVYLIEVMRPKDFYVMNRYYCRAFPHFLAPTVFQFVDAFTDKGITLSIPTFSIRELSQTEIPANLPHIEPPR